MIQEALEWAKEHLGLHIKLQPSLTENNFPTVCQGLGLKFQIVRLKPESINPLRHPLSPSHKAFRVRRAWTHKSLAPPCEQRQSAALPFAFSFVLLPSLPPPPTPPPPGHLTTAQAHSRRGKPAIVSCLLACGVEEAKFVIANLLWTHPKDYICETTAQPTLADLTVALVSNLPFSRIYHGSSLSP